MRNLLTALVTLQLADALSTLAMLELGLCVEANPMAAALIGCSPWALVLVKVGMAVLASPLLVRHAMAARLTVGIYSALMLWHAVGWALV